MTKEQRNEYARKYREKNKDKIREYQKRYWAEHGEEINAKRRNRKCYKYRCKKAIEYMNNYIEVEEAPINERIKIEFKELLKILKGDN